MGRWIYVPARGGIIVLVPAFLMLGHPFGLTSVKRALRLRACCVVLLFCFLNQLYSFSSLQSPLIFSA
jgi:hypothetical protein